MKKQIIQIIKWESLILVTVLGNNTFVGTVWPLSQVPLTFQGHKAECDTLS